MSVDAVLIAGPTASGKSGLALALAERLGGTVINTDSMQVYREARILTARPDDAALARAPHLLYGHVGVDETYSVARFQSDAAAALAAVTAGGRKPIFTGGSGLYFAALTEGLADIPAIPPALRARLRARCDALGADALFEELRARDPDSASLLRPSDRQRVLRAYEVFEATGRPLSAWQQDIPPLAPLASRRLVRLVIAPPRAELHRRIAERFDAMIEAGAAAEAARLGDLDPAQPAAKILGLRELQAAAAGAQSPAAARAAALAATRQYAKRQLTWARHRMADWVWLETAGPGNLLSQTMGLFS